MHVVTVGPVATSLSVQLARRYTALGGVSLLLGGLEALALRVQLMQPGMAWFEGAAFPGLLLLHAFTMVLLALVPLQLALVFFWMPRACGLDAPGGAGLATAGFWLHLAGAVVTHVVVIAGVTLGWGSEALPAPIWLGGLDASGIPPFHLRDPLVPGLLLVSLGIASASASVLLTVRPGAGRSPLAVTAVATALLWLPVFATTAASLAGAIGRDLSGLAQGVGHPHWWRVFALFEMPGAWGLVLPSLGVAVHAVRPPGGRAGEPPVVGFAVFGVLLFGLAGVAGLLGVRGYGQVHRLHLLFFAASLFALFAGYYRAWPGIAGREPDPRLGRTHLLLQILGALGMLVPMAWLAVQGAPRRIPVVPPGMASELAHMTVSLAAFALGGAALGGIAVLLRAPRR